VGGVGKEVGMAVGLGVGGVGGVGAAVGSRVGGVGEAVGSALGSGVGTNGVVVVNDVLIGENNDDEVVPEGVVLPGTPDVVLATSAVDVDAGDSVLPGIPVADVPALVPGSVLVVSTAGVGNRVGLGVGAAVGSAVGLGVGAAVGLGVGLNVGGVG
jgi:hypothetical protein